MTVDAETLDTETDGELETLLATAHPDPAAPTEPVDVKPEPSEAKEGTDAPDWEAKYQAELERSRNAQALMTQATSELNHLRQEMADLRAGMRQQQEPSGAGNSPDPYQRLREDYEELSPVFDELTQARREIAELKRQQTRQGETFEEHQRRSAEEVFLDQVRKAHPDVDTVAHSPDFKGWFARQTDGMQRMSRVSPEGAIHVMNLYKQQTGASPEDKLKAATRMQEPKVARNHSQPSTTAPVADLETLARLPQSEYDKNEDKIDQIYTRIMRQGG